MTTSSTSTTAGPQPSSGPAQDAAAQDPRASADGASAQITAEVLSWPGVTAATGSRCEWAFKLGRRELGHLHGDTTAHFGFLKDTWRELHVAGRIDFHPVFPGREGPAARRIASDDDMRDVIALLRINYDHLITRQPPGAKA